VTCPAGWLGSLQSALVIVNESKKGTRCKSRTLCPLAPRRFAEYTSHEAFPNGNNGSLDNKAAVALVDVCDIGGAHDSRPSSSFENAPIWHGVSLKRTISSPSRCESGQSSLGGQEKAVVHPSRLMAGSCSSCLSKRRGSSACTTSLLGFAFALL
jgi:hypothetical protein